MVPVGARLTDWWPLSPLGFLFHTTRSSSEDWVSWTDGDSDLLTLPTIRFLALLKLCQLLIVNQPSVIQLWSFYWSNMTLIPEFLDGISLIQISISGDVLLTTDYNISSLHCDTGYSLSLDSNPNIFPSQARSSATPTIWNWSDPKSFLIFIIKLTCFG